MDGKYLFVFVILYIGCCLCELSQKEKAHRFASFLEQESNQNLTAKIYDAREYLVQRIGETGANLVIGAAIQAMDSETGHMIEDSALNILAGIFNQSDGAMLNITSLLQQQNDIFNLVSSQFRSNSTSMGDLSFGNVLGTVRGILRYVSARMALPLGDHPISRACYDDSMDVLDALLQMDKYPWARSSKSVLNL